MTGILGNSSLGWHEQRREYSLGYSPKTPGMGACGLPGKRRNPTFISDIEVVGWRAALWLDRENERDQRSRAFWIEARAA